MEISGVVPALAGGVLIGLGAAMLLLFNGRVAGITGIVRGLLQPNGQETPWRALFVAGLIGGGLLMAWLIPGAFAVTLQRSRGALLAAGLLVGFGTSLGNGCTSGHGVCGVARLSPRSLLATGLFMTTGALTVWAVGRVFGGAL